MKLYRLKNRATCFTTYNIKVLKWSLFDQFILPNICYFVNKRNYYRAFYLNL